MSTPQRPDLETLVEKVILAILKRDSGLLIPGYPQDGDGVRETPHYTAAARLQRERIFNSGIYDLAVTVEYVAEPPVEIVDGEVRDPDPAAPAADARSAQYAALFNAVTLPSLTAAGFIGAVDMPQNVKREKGETGLEHRRSFTFTVIACQQPAI